MWVTLVYFEVLDTISPLEPTLDASNINAHHINFVSEGLLHYLPG